MKAKRLLALASLAIMLGLMLQSFQPSKKELSEKLVGMWQCVVINNNDFNDVAYTPLIKCYNADHSYKFFGAFGAMGLSHDGRWKIDNDSILIEDTDYNASSVGQKGSKAHLLYHFVDDNTLIIIWDSPYGIEFYEVYKRIVRGPSKQGKIHKGNNYAYPVNDFIREVMKK